MDDDRFKTSYVLAFRIAICTISIGAVVMMIKRHLVKNEWISKYSQEKLGEVVQNRHLIYDKTKGDNQQMENILEKRA